jgi:hypothetical protein
MTVALAVAVLGGAGCGSWRGGHASTGPTPAPVPLSPTAGPGPPGAPNGSGAPSAGNLVTLAGQARSVETTAALGGLASIHLSGPSVLTVTADVTDAAGVHHGTGTLTARGSDLVVAGTGPQLRGRLIVRPGSVTVDSPAIDATGPLTVTAAKVTFQAPAPAPPATNGASPAPTTTAPPPPPVTLQGPVTVQSAGSISPMVSGTGLRMVDPPADLHLASPEADLSWAGSGSITTEDGRPIQAGFLGVRAQQVDATLHRSPGQVDVRGTGRALQAFADGAPRLGTPARFDVLSTGATTGFFVKRRAFVWTPRNLGSTYDMAILRIRPGNAAARSVHIGLQPMPAMFGGEPHSAVGGDTSGLRSGDRIDSLVARNGDDKRSIGYDAPAGSVLVLVVEGNFDPITVTVTV